MNTTTISNAAQAATPAATSALTREDLCAIARRARTLDERLAEASASRVDEFAEMGWNRWRRAIGGEEKLLARLDRTGADRSLALRALGTRRPLAEDELPAWTLRLSEICASSQTDGPPAAATPAWLGDCARAARRRLLEISPASSVLSVRALDVFEQGLRKELIALTSPARREFDRAASPETSTDQEFWREYAVLARQIVRWIATWTDSTRELCERLVDDADLLARRFGAGGEIIDVRIDLSDRHRGGRRVCELHFASGAEVIYKPRSVAGEAAFQEILHDLHSDLGDLTPPTLSVAMQEGYGWMEKARTAPLRDREQAEIIFTRAGCLLGLAYALGANDLHMHNIVATEQGPVIVDLETILQRGDEVVGDGVMHQARRRLYDSFLRTGLLSLFRRDSEDRFLDHGGLLGEGPENGFFLDGERLRPENYAPAMERGLTSVWNALAERDPQTFLAPLSKVRPRRIERSSEGYAHLLRRLTSPSFQRDGFSASLELEFLGGDPDRVREEKTSLQNLDVPVFSDDPADGLAAAEQRLRRLDAESLQRQIEILRAATSDEREAIQGRPASERRSGDASVEPLAEALRLAERLRDAAIRDADGAATWLSSRVVRLTGRSERGMSYHLYGGGVGIAVFLAASARAFGDDSWAELARAAMRPAERILDDPRIDELARRESIGACSGLGSIVYGATLVAQILGDASILDTARRAARLITPERIAADRRYDVESGVAGALLALTALDHAAPSSELQEQAALCGDYLASHVDSLGEDALAGFAHGASGKARALITLAERTTEADRRARLLDAARAAFAFEQKRYRPGLKNWAVVGAEGERSMVAWCHGAPGVALARLHAWEFFTDSQDAASIREELQRELEIALRTTLRAEIGSVDHLCCGNFGRTDILLHAAETLDRADLRAAALLRARQALQGRAGAEIREDFGFFRGVAGIGYALLRMHEANESISLPSVLSFEPFSSSSQPKEILP